MALSNFHYFHLYILNVLEFDTWIHYEKIAEPYFFSCQSFLTFWSYAPLNKGTV